MLFLNIIKQSPIRFHSNDLYQRGSELINHIIEAFKNNSCDIKESANTLIAPLFEFYMDNSEVVFNSLSKALALDYYQNRSYLKRDVADKYSRTVNIHSNIWQESQAAIYELAENGNMVLTNKFGNTKYHNLQSSIKKNKPELISVLNMVNAYLLSEIYAFLPILDEENLIDLNMFDWNITIEHYQASLRDFSDYANAAHILSDTVFKEAIAI